VKDVEAKLYVNTDARPLFFKARSVPYALRQKVEHELERLQNQDVITPVPHPDWAALIVAVVNLFVYAEITSLLLTKCQKLKCTLSHK